MDISIHEILRIATDDYGMSKRLAMHAGLWFDTQADSLLDEFEYHCKSGAPTAEIIDEYAYPVSAGTAYILSFDVGFSFVLGSLHIIFSPT